MSKEYRIFGPPGTGKTTTLSRLITAACQTYGSDAVLAASFTKTAARELVSRDIPMDDRQIGTLHALCYRALDGPKIVGRSHLKDWNAEYAHWRFEGGGSPNLDDPYGDPNMDGRQEGDRFLDELGRLRGLQTPEDIWPIRLQSFAAAWKDFKSNLWLMDFTDLIETCLIEAVPIPNGARVFFLDEVQDFSRLELSLARAWGQSCEVVYLCGDEDQCLYRFKGASPDAFLSPALPADQVSILEQSYRVPRAVHAAACAWAEQIDYRMPKTYRPRDADGLVETLPITSRYLAPLKEPLQEWVQAGKTIALLASCSFFIDPIKHQLRDWGIPFHNPWRRQRGDWNPLTGRNGTVSAAERLLSYRKVADGLGWWTHHDLWQWVAPLEAEGLFTRGAKTQIRQLAEADDTAAVAVSVENLERWIPGHEAAEAAANGVTEWLSAHILQSHTKPLKYACAILEAHGRAALTQSPRVIIGTIHSVKGGEADIVVLFPDLSPAGFREWTSPGDGRDSIRRCFYVGMTRAREALYWAQPSGMSIGGYL